MQSGELVVDNIDVFCEKGVFDVDQSRRILQAGLDAGLAINFHGEELNRLHSAEVSSALVVASLAAVSTRVTEIKPREHRIVY